MGFVSGLLGTRTSMNLASQSPRSAGRAMSQGSGDKDADRIQSKLLEEDYRFDSVTFNIINKQVQMIMQAGFVIKTKKSTYQKFYDEFFENIGEIGEEITKEELVEYTIQDMLMYGNSYTELIYAGGDVEREIVDLKIIPEKRMETR